jgi:O-acetyl-ADP-ribose deacetylase (regulator of RNase III)
MCMVNKIRSVAFCCISTGVFGYPQVPACHVALKTVKNFLEQTPNNGFESIIFNTFLQSDFDIYQEFVPKYFTNK